ncbi:hypothetical protein SAMD00024442_2_13 [Candidatus Symbiothrix dinenymphae]|nr:hypothetical protein SAMD00024442_2_13 [Candidatus Symbiothrix dinenymphae]
MKKRRNLAAMALAAGMMMMTGCETSYETPVISVNKTVIEAVASGSTYYITVTSNNAWTVDNITLIPEWCVVDPTSGSGDGTIAVSVKKNEDTNPRATSINITSGSATAQVTVNQETASTRSYISAIAPAHEYPITVGWDSIPDAPWTAVVTEGGGWCHLSSTSGTGYDTIVVSVDENSTAAPRVAVIITKSRELPQRQITVTQRPLPTAMPPTFDMVDVAAFKIGKYEVTEGLWKAVMESNPSQNVKGDNFPVENVSWDDIQMFLKVLNAKTGKAYRLPTEAEWEYAAKGGQNHKYSGSNTVGDVAWYSENSGMEKHEVGKKTANALGIHDMSGNVWEWCSDDWYNSSAHPTTPPAGYVNGTYHVYRGGSWFGAESACEVSDRPGTQSTRRAEYLGFRLAL